MRCPDCDGKGWRLASVDLLVQPTFCYGCGGTGHAHCCDGPVGAWDEPANAGDDGSPSSEPTTAETS